MRALIVDDVEMNRDMLQMFLGGRWITIMAADGEEAIELFQEAVGSGNHFDLICMDIGLPGVSGLEALKRIRELEQENAVPRATAFMVTASSSPDDMVDALVSGGCDDYLAKPLMKQSFLALLEKYGLA